MTEREVSKRLSDNFGEAIKISSIEPVQRGQHQQHHFVARASKGRAYGLKLAAGGTSQEKLVSEIARLLKAPNATRCVLDSEWAVASIEALHNQTVAKIEWLTGDCGDLDNSQVLESIRENAQEFYVQFGEWCSLGLLLSLEDRDNPGNWVWDRSEARLLMIDFESAFVPRREPSQYTRLLRRRNIGLANRDMWLQNPDTYPPGFAEGFFSMRKKIRRGIDRVLDLAKDKIASRLLTDLRDYAQRKDSQAFSEVIATV